MTPGQRIRSIREARGLSQTQCADAAKVSQALWSAIERDQTTPAVDKAHAIASAVGATRDELWPAEPNGRAA